ncbi:MAG: DciA family protein [Bacteroidales bacterium]|nr:DciA family protein [Bacteroidales bacterium]MDD4670166.1 DciA family protein [Bacteroidales bacterium]
MRIEQSKIVGDLISDYLKEDGLEEGILMARIFEAWDLVVYEQTGTIMTAEQSKQLTLNKFYKEGILTCKIASSVIRNQLHFQQDALKRKLNKMLQGNYIDKIVLT